LVLFWRAETRKGKRACFTAADRMKPASVLPCFPNTTRGLGTPLKTDPKRNLIIYALDRTVRAVLLWLVLRSRILPLQAQHTPATLWTHRAGDACHRLRW
jgi:hypothetical protein